MVQNSTRRKLQCTHIQVIHLIAQYSSIHVINNHKQENLRISAKFITKQILRNDLYHKCSFKHEKNPPTNTTHPNPTNRPSSSRFLGVQTHGYSMQYRKEMEKVK